ncbi:hypothetical protein [Virgibacillus ainsalahensis]
MKDIKLLGMAMVVMVFVIGCSDSDTAETSPESPGAGSENHGEEAETTPEDEELEIINIHDFNLEKTEADLDQTIFFSNEEMDEDPKVKGSSVNFYISEDFSSFTTGGNTLLADSTLMINENGEGAEPEYPGNNDMPWTPAVYANSFYYTAFEDIIYKVGEEDHSVETMVEPGVPVHQMKVDEERLYYITKDEHTYILHATDLQEGNEGWSTDPFDAGLSGSMMSNITMDDEMIIYNTNSFTKALNKETGEEIWSQDTSYYTLHPTDDALFALMHTGSGTTGEYTLTELDKETGEEVSTLDLPKTFEMYEQTYPDVQSNGNMLFIDLEQSVLGYQIDSQTLAWAFTGNDGLEAEGYGISEDLMDVDVRISENGTVILTGTMNSQNAQKAEDFLVTVAPTTGEVTDGYVMDGEITPSQPDDNQDNTFIVVPYIEEDQEDPYEREAFLTTID